MEIVLVEFGYSGEFEAEAFKTIADAKEYLVNVLEFLTDGQFEILSTKGSFERSWGSARMYKNYTVIGV